MAEQTAALEAEADLRKTLGEEFTSVKAGLKPGEEISNEQMIAVMADAVGASSDAQGKLILNKVASIVGESNAEIKRTQKLLMELAAGVSMSQTRAANPDFDIYKTEVAGIMSTTRGLSTDDALLLAKAKRSKDQPSRKEIESERPGVPPLETTLSSRGEYVQEKKDDGEQLSPKAVFHAAAEAAVTKIMSERRG